MDIRTKTAVLILAISAIGFSSHAQLLIPPADGSDGQLVVTNGSTNINLALATNGSWLNSSMNPGFGTYDPTIWAVVFKYTNVFIGAGASVTFSNNATHAPVVWLVNGNVTINGNLSLDGFSNSGDTINLVEPGPGGFRGGFYNGFGPGGSGGPGVYLNTYGNAQIVPLIGGSGGGGNGPGECGGGGGGAILIAATGTIQINSPGSCHADGGTGGNPGAGIGGGGSGGGVRLVASQISGNGTIFATGSANGGPGQTRLECTNTTFGFPNISPTPTTLALTNGQQPVIFPLTSPTAIITNIIAGAQANTVPADPLAALPQSGNDDVRIVTTNAVTIQIQTMNFPTNGRVYVSVKPEIGIFNGGIPLTAVFDSGTSNVASWHASATQPLPYPGHTVIQAHAVY